MLNLFTPPCFAAIGAMNAELKSKKWLFGALGLQFGIGYSLAFLVYFFGCLFTGSIGSAFDAIWMPVLGWLIVGGFALVITVLIVRKSNQLKKERAKKAELKNADTVRI